MVTQLHLAVVMAIDARLLVLDEPTLGLDLLSRKAFYDSLLNDYLERSRTVVVATHQVEELQHILTDVVFIDRGRVVFNRSMDDVESQYREVLVHPDAIATARALNPIHERQAVGRSILIFEGVDRQQLAALGDVQDAHRRRSVRRHHEPTRGPGPGSRRMNTPSNVMAESPSAAIAPVDISLARRLYWLVARELWENRAVYLAPLVVAAVFLAGFLIGLVRLPDRMRAAMALPPDAAARSHRAAVPVRRARRHAHRDARRDLLLCRCACTASGATAAFSSGNHCPSRISTTVLSKASIPILVLPLVAFALTAVAQLVMLVASSAVLAGSGMDGAMVWTTCRSSRRR